MHVLLSVDNVGWREAVPQIREHYAAFGDRLPQQLGASLDSLEAALA
jgi:phosphoenolpyruvate carboxykinase (GTP)